MSTDRKRPLSSFYSGELHRQIKGLEGCAVCGKPILADTEDWPAPLCPDHAPLDLLDVVGEWRVGTRKPRVLRNVDAGTRKRLGCAETGCNEPAHACSNDGATWYYWCRKHSDRERPIATIRTMPIPEGVETQVCRAGRVLSLEPFGTNDGSGATLWRGTEKLISGLTRRLRIEYMRTWVLTPGEVLRAEGASIFLEVLVSEPGDVGGGTDAPGSV